MLLGFNEIFINVKRELRIFFETRCLYYWLYYFMRLHLIIIFYKAGDIIMQNVKGLALRKLLKQDDIQKIQEKLMLKKYCQLLIANMSVYYDS